MSRQRWGTFSVKDHLAKQAFVTETLLYDRLLIPVPKPGGRQHWIDSHWDPQRLDDTRRILGDLAIPVPWDSTLEDRFHDRYQAAKEAAFDLENVRASVAATRTQESNNADLPYWLTRSILTDNAVIDQFRGDADVWALAAYPSLADFHQDYQLAAQTEPEAQVKREEMAALLTHEFFVPRSTGESDTDLLNKAVKLSKSDIFQKDRQHHYAWQDDLLSRGVSGADAVEKMKAIRQEYEEFLKDQQITVTKKFAFTLAEATLGLVAGGFVPLAGAAGIAALVKFWVLDSKGERVPTDLAPAAMVYDVQRILNRAP